MYVKFSFALTELTGRVRLVVQTALALANWRVSALAKRAVLACTLSRPLASVVPHLVMTPFIRTQLACVGRCATIADASNAYADPTAMDKLVNAITAKMIAAIFVFILLSSSFSLSQPMFKANKSLSKLIFIK